MLTFPMALIVEAKKWTDCKEDPGRDNRSVCVDKIHQYVRDYVSNDPWCAMFVTMILDKVTKAFGVKNTIGMTAGTHNLLALANQADIRIDRKPAVGSIMFYDTTKAGSRATGHVGYIVEVKPDGKIFTIEGNTGDRVGFRTHTVKSKFRFVHVEDMVPPNKKIMNMQLAGFNPWLTGTIALIGGGIVYRYFR